MKTWKIAYTIVDGEYEYGDYFTRELAAPLDEATVARLIADRWGLTKNHWPAARKRFLRELKEDGMGFLPGTAAASKNSAGKRPPRSSSRLKTVSSRA